MFENKFLLVERIAVVEKAARAFTNGLVPDASASVSHKHIVVDETRIELVIQLSEMVSTHMPT